MPKQPQTLKDTALYLLLRQEWNSANLQPLFSALAYLEKDEDSEDELPPELCVDPRLRKVRKKIQSKIRKIIEKYDFPLNLKIKWALAWDFLKRRVEEFCNEIVQMSWKDSNVQFCIERLHITATGDIDEQATIETIIKDSKFQIIFNSILLAEYGITKDTIKKICQTILKEIKDKKLSADPMEIKKGAVKYLKVIMSEEEMIAQWEILYSFYEKMHENDSRSKHASKLQISAAVSNLNGVKYYLNLEPPEKRQECLIKLAHYNMVLGDDKLNEAMIVFLYENMHRNIFTKCLLESNYRHVFCEMLTSCRYRHLCVEFFKEAIVPIMANNPGLFRSQFWWGLRGQNFGLLCPKYHTYDIMEVMKSIWTLAPAHLKQHDDFVYSIIPQLTVARCDFEAMTFFMKFFDLEQQKVILGCVIIKMVKISKTEWIPECLKAANRLGLNITDYKQLISKELLKKYIPNDIMMLLDKIERSEIDGTFYPEDRNQTDIVMKFVCGSKDEVNNFRIELLNDQSLITFIVQYSLLDKSFSHFELWLNNGNRHRIKEFREETIKKDWFQENCIKKFLNYDTVGTDKNRDAEYLIRLIELKKLNRKFFKIYPELANKIFAHFVKYEYFERDSFIEDMYITYITGSKKDFYEQFFNSDLGKDAILSLFTNLDSLQVDASLRMPPEHIVKRHMFVINVYIQKFETVARQVENWLIGYGHPNQKFDAILTLGPDFRDVAEFGPDGLVNGRKLVDAYYRIFRCVLRHPKSFAIPDYMTDFTEISMQIAKAIGLDIPVVL